ncbi:SANTA protein [Ancylostoma ceylanicum]|uniref:SANTA protein n=1 Tax=Ancylostoma ceylanicum TaxID=53326 RepID=A0A0D6LID9_9BILA|nr:SANTA protein [Ancylostoma ceylanicum]
MTVHAYLPEDDWYSLYDYKYGQLIKPDYQTFPAPWSSLIPVFVKGGSILPRQKPNVTTTSTRDNAFELLIAPGTKFTLFFGRRTIIQAQAPRHGRQQDKDFDHVFKKIIEISYGTKGRAEGFLYWDDGESIVKSFSTHKYYHWRFEYSSTEEGASLSIKTEHSASLQIPTLDTLEIFNYRYHPDFNSFQLNNKEIDIDVEISSYDPNTAILYISSEHLIKMTGKGPFVLKWEHSVEPRQHGTAMMPGTGMMPCPTQVTVTCEPVTCATEQIQKSTCWQYKAKVWDLVMATDAVGQLSRTHRISLRLWVFKKSTCWQYKAKVWDLVMATDAVGQLSRTHRISLRLWVFKFIDVEDIESFGVCVEGYRPNDETETVLRNWHSTAISVCAILFVIASLVMLASCGIQKRITPSLLHSCSGSVYELRGSIDRELARQYGSFFNYEIIPLLEGSCDTVHVISSFEGYPPELVELFLNGFPENWKSILKEYFYVVKTTNPMNASHYFSSIARRRSLNTVRGRNLLSGGRESSTVRSFQVAFQGIDLILMFQSTLDDAVELSDWSIRFAPIGIDGPELGFPRFVLLGNRKECRNSSHIFYKIPTRRRHGYNGFCFRRQVVELSFENDLVWNLCSGFPKMFVAKFIRGFPPDWRTRITELYDTFFGNLDTHNSIESQKETKQPLLFSQDSEESDRYDQLQKSHYVGVFPHFVIFCSYINNRNYGLGSERTHVKSWLFEEFGYYRLQLRTWERCSNSIRPSSPLIADSSPSGYSDEPYIRDATSSAAVSRRSSTSGPEVRRSRSGRCIHAPLAQWAGERVRYDGFGNVIGVQGVNTETMHSKGAVGALALSNYYGVSPARPPRQSEAFLQVPELAVDHGPKTMKRRKALTDSEEYEIERELNAERRLLLEQARELRRQQENLIEMERRLAYHEAKWRKKRAKERRFEGEPRSRHYSPVRMVEERNYHRKKPKVEKQHIRKKAPPRQHEEDNYWREDLLDAERLEDDWAREDAQLSDSDYSDGDSDWHEPVRKRRKKRFRRVRKQSSSEDSTTVVANRRQFLAEAEDDDTPIRRRSSLLPMGTPVNSAQRERQDRYFHHLISKGGCRDMSRMNFSRVGNSTRFETTEVGRGSNKGQNYGSLHNDLDYVAKMTRKAARKNAVLEEDSDRDLELEEDVEGDDDDVF